MSNTDVATRAEIYDEALANFRKAFPQFNPYRYLSSAMNMSESALRQKCRDEDHHFTVQEEETLFRLCHFPQGFVMKSLLVFAMPQSEAKHGTS